MTWQRGSMLQHVGPLPNMPAPGRAPLSCPGVGQLRRFLEHLLQRRYLENVPTIGEALTTGLVGPRAPASVERGLAAAAARQATSAPLQPCPASRVPFRSLAP